MEVKNLAKTHDYKFLKKLKCVENTIYVFDKVYNDYKALTGFSNNETEFVTCLKNITASNLSFVLNFPRMTVSVLRSTSFNIFL